MRLIFLRLGKQTSQKHYFITFSSHALQHHARTRQVSPGRMKAGQETAKQNQEDITQAL